MQIQKRRSIYHLGKKEVVSIDKIIDIAFQSVKHCPTAFNSQTSRAVILLNKHHENLWNLVLEKLKPLTPADKFPDTVNKIKNSFQSGLGTILFFEDIDIITGLQKQFPLYKDNFPKWSEHASGMLQFAIWQQLAEEGVGASLQHYNPLIDDDVKKNWNIPSNWHLIAQMPFGSIESPADKKDFLPLDSRIKTFI